MTTSTASPALPVHYRAFYFFVARFSILMLILGLLVGIVYQESSRKAPISAMLPPGMHLESVIDLALSHGHIFLIGALIPLGLSWLLYMGLQLGANPISAKSLKVGSWMYFPGAVGAIALMIYKGYHFLLGVRGGNTDFVALQASFFAGNHALRAASYGTIHTVMAIGLLVIVIPIWKSLKTAPKAV
jgi:hypothetical protein